MSADLGMAPGKPSLIVPATICALVAAAFDSAFLSVLAAVSSFAVELVLVAVLSVANADVAKLLSVAPVVVSELLSAATVVIAGLLVAGLMSPVPDNDVDLLAERIPLTTELLTLLAKLPRLV